MEWHATSAAESTMKDEISRNGNEKCLKSHSSHGDCSKDLQPKLVAIESVESGIGEALRNSKKANCSQSVLVNVNNSIVLDALACAYSI